MKAVSMAAVKWGLGPIFVAVLSAALGRAAFPRRTDAFEGALQLSESERRTLANAPELSMVNAVWALGDADSARKTLQAALDRVQETEGTLRARLFLRFGIIDANPDGQAAVFAQACVSDPNVCDHVPEAAERETRARFVAPGNRLPLSLLGGHPPIEQQ